MIAVSGAIIFAGYQLLVYGYSQVQGENAGFFDLLWPGRYKNAAAPDGPSSSASGGSTNSDTRTKNGIVIPKKAPTFFGGIVG